VKISTRDRQFLIVGGIIAIAVIVVYVAPLLLPQDLSATVENKKNYLQKQREMIGQEESLKARIAQDQQRIARDLDQLLPGDNPSAAGPALQKVLQDFADAVQVEISRKTILPQQQLSDNLTKVTVQVDVNCNLDQLVRLIGAIENYDKFLKVDELFIQPMGPRSKDQIRPSLKVAGFVATPTPAAKPAEKAAGGK
jgi:type II secretory pathway component PulM